MQCSRAAVQPSSPPPTTHLYCPTYSLLEVTALASTQGTLDALQKATHESATCRREITATVSGQAAETACPGVESRWRDTPRAWFELYDGLGSGLRQGLGLGLCCVLVMLFSMACWEHGHLNKLADAPYFFSPHIRSRTPPQQPLTLSPKPLLPPKVGANGSQARLLRIRSSLPSHNRRGLASIRMPL